MSDILEPPGAGGLVHFWRRAEEWGGAPRFPAVGHGVASSL